MTRALISCVALALTLASCTQRLICPAYQSAFIYDKPTQKEKFVYYNDNPNASKDILASNSKTITLPARDSSWDKSTVLPGPALPQVRRVKKDRYLLLPDKTYKQAMRSLMTVEMKQVLPKKTDSLDVKAALDSAARSVSDTLNVQGGKPGVQAEEDSVYAITKTKEKYNLDQDIYMWYFRDVLVLPDVRAAKMEQKEVKATKSKSKKEGGFFKNLFGKKEKPKEEKIKKVKSDSTSVEAPKQKKSLNPFKKKASSTDTEKKKPDATKKEEDDGF
jgi:hypothetical protein